NCMEPVNKSAGTLKVAIFDDTVWIKISGRANFTSSMDLKKVVTELWERCYRRFVFEISDCVLMDSTFLGTMAGIGLKFAEANQRGETCSIEIANPNSRLAGLLEDLGVAHLFKIVHVARREDGQFEPLSQNGTSAPRVEVTRTCLEAHKILMGLNPENVSKFKDVTQFLAEDLKKLEQANREVK
ncbi:MAG: STAS domain-containing protein, partial [Verrucomicrobiota bacterium]